MKISYKGYAMEIQEGQTVSEFLSEEIEKADVDIIACKFNNELKRLNFKPTKGGEIELVDIGSKDGMRIYRRGLIYIVSKAFSEIYPEFKLTVNYQLHHALFGEVTNMEITEEVLEKINARVKEIAQANLPIIKKKMTKEEATSFYEKENTLRGKLQLDCKDKKEVTLYYCEDYYNYFYGILPISTGYVKNYEIIKYHDGFAIRFPSSKTPTVLDEFKDSPKLLATLEEYEDVHKVLNIDTLHKLNTSIKEDTIKEYILLDEALHEKKVAGIADDIVKNKNVKVILIAGPSSSGKTTFSKRLELQLKLNGLDPLTISVDNYFVERDETPIDEYGKYDFESIKAIDTELLNNHLIKLLNGEEIEAPTFNFFTGSKEFRGDTMKLEEGQVLVMEGIHCLNDELTYLIPKEQKYKVYISCLTVLNLDYHNRIPTTDSRLLRRMVRDRQFRGYSASNTLEIWPSVNRGEAKNIFPFQEQADSMFNSSLIYEIAVLKKHAVPLLSEISKEHAGYTEARRLLSMLRYFEDIPDDYVPNNSLIKEFIGGSIFE